MKKRTIKAIRDVEVYSGEQELGSLRMNKLLFIVLLVKSTITCKGK